MIYLCSPLLDLLSGFLIFCCYSQGCNDCFCTGIISSISGGVIPGDKMAKSKGVVLWKCSHKNFWYLWDWEMESLSPPINPSGLFFLMNYHKLSSLSNTDLFINLFILSWRIICFTILCWFLPYHFFVFRFYLLYLLIWLCQVLVSACGIFIGSRWWALHWAFWLECAGLVALWHVES